MKCYGQTDRQMDGRTDGQTDRQTKCIPIIPSPLRGGGLIQCKGNYKIPSNTNIYSKTVQ